MISKKQQILETALALFAQEGYQRVGVDRVASVAGVTKMTLYKHYPSKTILVIEVLKARDRRFRESMSEFVETFSDVPMRLCAVFAWHHRWFQRADFHGCMFINAAAEFHNAEEDVRHVAAEHKLAIIDFIARVIGAKAPPSAAMSLATAISLLLDGAIVAAQVTHDKDAARKAWDTARRLFPGDWGAAPTLDELLKFSA